MNKLFIFVYFRSIDYTKGIFQSIGFKEFHDYLMLPEEEKGEKKVRVVSGEEAKIDVWIFYLVLSFKLNVLLNLKIRMIN